MGTPLHMTQIEVFEKAAAEQWELTQSLVEVAVKPFQGICASKLSEDAFQRQRRAESKSTAEKVSDLRLWTTLIERRVLSQVHGFDEVAYEAEALRRGMGSTEPANFHIPTKQGCEQFSDLKSYQSKAEWYSPQPLHYFGNLGDLSMARGCQESGEWTQASKSWLSLLLNGEGICLRKMTGDGQFYIGFRSFAGLASQGWPVESVVADGQVLYVPRIVEDHNELPYLHIYDLAQWEAFSFSWIGPLHQRARFNRRHGGIAILPDTSLVGLLRCVALKAFWRLPKTPLVQVAKHVGCALEDGASLLSVINALVRFACPELDDKAVVDILQQRTIAQDTLQEFVECSEAEEPQSTLLR